MAGRINKGFGNTWWSKKWIEAMDIIGWGDRIAKGKASARDGNVAFIEIFPGSIKARVRDNRKIPYMIKIGLPIYSDSVWDSIIDAMSEKAIYIAKLLIDEIPEDIEDIFNNIGLSLFPTKPEDVYTSCSCPDRAYLCKHIGAVYYALAQEMETNPFLLFQIRGMEKDELLQKVRIKRTAQCKNRNMEVDAQNLEGLDEANMQSYEEMLHSFWNMPEQSDIDIIIEQPIVNESILKRLGHPPFMKDKRDMLRQLEADYKRVMLAALNLGYEE